MQLIFRKVADVKKEKELAEKRKNDPPLDLANDHPVRKLISRFRKISDTKHDVKVTNMNDAERGTPTGSGGDISSTIDRPTSGTTRVITVSENPNNNTTSGPRLGGGSSKWGKLFGGPSSTSASAATTSVAALNTASGTNDQNEHNVGNKSGCSKSKEDSALDKAIPLNDLSPKIETRSGESSKIVGKPMSSKWGRFMPKPQEPIEESPEEEMRSNLKKTDSTDSGILKSNTKLDQMGLGHDIFGEGILHHHTHHHQNNNGNNGNSNNSQSHQHSHPLHTAFNINAINNLTKETVSNSSHSTNASSGETSFVPPVLNGGLSAAEQHMLTSLYDIRLEIKEELDSLRQKMNRIDEHISEVLRFFSPLSTPCSSVSTYPSSKFNSPHNITSSNSADQSPKNSLSSSPRHDEVIPVSQHNMEEEDPMIGLNIASPSGLSHHHHRHQQQEQQHNSSNGDVPNCDDNATSAIFHQIDYTPPDEILDTEKSQNVSSNSQSVSQQPAPPSSSTSSSSTKAKNKSSTASKKKDRRRSSSKSSNTSNESHATSTGTPEPVPGRIHGSTQVDVLDGEESVVVFRNEDEDEMEVVL